jgi:hypothetical protein
MNLALKVFGSVVVQLTLAKMEHLKRLSFVYSSDNNDREGLEESNKCFFMSMKKCDNNLIVACHRPWPYGGKHSSLKSHNLLNRQSLM